MNIRQAKDYIENTVRLYLKKDEFGEYRIPVVRQRPVFFLFLQGSGGTAIQQMWDALQEQGLETMYLEVVPSNEAALRLYHKLGFCNLNTLTLNRSVKKKSQLGTETICGLPFKTYRPHQG